MSISARLHDSLEKGAYPGHDEDYAKRTAKKRICHIYILAISWKALWGSGLAWYDTSPGKCPERW